MERRHQLVLGVERHLGDARVDAPRLVDVEPALRGEHDERRLGRVADDLAVAHRRVVGERHRQQERLERRVRVAGDAQDLALRSSSPRPRPSSGARRPRAARAVIWLSVSVPVLSEQIADVEPSVSTERSRLTIAPLAASACVPSESIVVTTAGQAGRDRRDREADADQEELVEVVAVDQPEDDRRAPARPPAMIVISTVSWSSWRVSGVFSCWTPLEHPGDLADLGRHAGRRDDHLAAAARHGRVHVGHVERGRRAGRRRPAPASTDFSTGVLSPVSAASSISSVAATSRRPSAGILSPASKVTTSPGHELLGRDVHRLAAAAHVRLDQQHLLERRDALGRLALLVQAEDGVQHGQADDHDARSRTPAARRC